MNNNGKKSVLSVIKFSGEKDALIRHEKSVDSEVKCVNCDVILSSYQKDVQCRWSKCFKDVGFSSRQGVPYSFPSLQMYRYMRPTFTISL